MTSGIWSCKVTWIDLQLLPPLMLKLRTVFDLGEVLHVWSYTCHYDWYTATCTYNLLSWNWGQFIFILKIKIFSSTSLLIFAPMTKNVQTWESEIHVQPCTYVLLPYNLLPTQSVPLSKVCPSQSVPLPKMLYCSFTKRNSVLFLPISIWFIFLPSYLLTSKRPRWPSRYTRSLTGRSQA